MKCDIKGTLDECWWCLLQKIYQDVWTDGRFVHIEICELTPWELEVQRTDAIALKNFQDEFSQSRGVGKKRRKLLCSSKVKYLRKKGRNFPSTKRILRFWSVFDRSERKDIMVDLVMIWQVRLSMRVACSEMIASKPVDLRPPYRKCATYLEICPFLKSFSSPLLNSNNSCSFLARYSRGRIGWKSFEFMNGTEHEALPKNGSIYNETRMSPFSTHMSLRQSGLTSGGREYCPCLEAQTKRIVNKKESWMLFIMFLDIAWYTVVSAKNLFKENMRAAFGRLLV